MDFQTVPLYYTLKNNHAPFTTAYEDAQRSDNWEIKLTDNKLSAGAAYTLAKSMQKYSNVLQDV